jgi:hypothetical protein
MLKHQKKKLKIKTVQKQRPQTVLLCAGVECGTSLVWLHCVAGRDAVYCGRRIETNLRGN